MFFDHFATARVNGCPEPAGGHSAETGHAVGPPTGGHNCTGGLQVCPNPAACLRCALVPLDSPVILLVPSPRCLSIACNGLSWNCASAVGVRARYRDTNWHARSAQIPLSHRKPAFKLGAEIDFRSFSSEGPTMRFVYQDHMS